MMKLAWVPLIACMVVLPHAFGEVSFHDWQCGSEERSRRYAFDSVMDNCPTLAAEMNHCCAVHDECYVRQAGQDKCDDNFCACNKRVLNRTEGKMCQPFADTVCTFMPFLGMFAYDNSVNYTEPADLPKHIPDDVVLHKHYGTLYSNCPKVNATLSSCAIVYDNCIYDGETCAKQICNCLNEAYSLDLDEQCGQATRLICKYAHEQATHWFVRALQREPSSTMFLIGVLIGAICAALYYVLRRRRCGDEDSIKYTNVIDA